ncbi:MAG: gliding motility-associated C-terminal domain-containing protein [Saprospiraceae bacterium]|nr:gliding motility-associated C-terminal domain-containing protein [Saprospiraceae bacterium]
MKRTIYLFLTLHLLISFHADAQKDFPCATDQLLQQALTDPARMKRHSELEHEALQHFRASKDLASTERGGQVVTIPVVVHIIHDGGAENIPDAQVQQGIAWLNQAFANQGYYDQGSGTTVGIQFCLAQRTPEGQPTNGITRVQNTLTDLVIETQEIAMKNLSRWNPREYVNIWVLRSVCSSAQGCGISAFAYSPSFHGLPLDGIVTESVFFGTTLAANTVLAHEMGHYFGLYHTFQGGCKNDDCLTDGDRVCDTPPDQSTSGVPCGQSVNTCSTDTQSGFATDQPDMTHNYMDYGNLNCMHDFTQGQASRMNFFLNGARKSLLDSKGCLPPCPLPTLAAFVPNDTTVLAGSALSFVNVSQNAVAFGWSLNGAAFGGQQNASYLFDTAGVFTVQLIAQPLNGQLCAADTALATVQVLCPVVAGFAVSSLSPEVGQTVYVANTSQNALQYEWFVNGESQGAILDSLVFTAEGIYDIRLVARGDFCATSITQTVAVRDSCRGKTFLMRPSSSQTAGSETFSCATVLTDGNLLYGGNIGLISSSPDQYGAFLVKKTPDGTLVWAKHFYRDNFQTHTFRQIAAMPDGGFAALIGQSPNIFVPGANQAVVLGKFSSEGEVLWMRTLDTTAFALLRYQDLLVTPEGDIIAGSSAKFDAAGNLLWYNAQTFLNVYQTALMPDGGFVACGEGVIITTNVLRYAADGSLIWSKKLSSTLANRLNFVTVGQDGHIYALGTTITPAGVLHAWLTKLTPEGEIIWSKRYYRLLPTFFVPLNVVATPTGITISTRTSIYISLGNIKQYRSLMHTDYEGNIVWLRHYESVPNTLNSLTYFDGGYLMTSPLIKADPLGYIGECPPDQWDMTSDEVPTSTENVTVGLVSPWHFPSDTLLANDLDMALDTICTPACPRGVEICNNGLDDDGDGLFDCLDPDCDCGEDVCAPGEARIWYFGNRSGLDFNTEPPTVLTDGQTMNHQLGSAVMCDPKGNLLFYSDGQTVFNRFHQPMPNGTDIGTSGSISEVIAVPYPGKAGLYYLFIGSFPTGTAVYTLVDMKLDGGKGDVVAGEKAVPFSTGNRYHTVTRSCTTNTYWLIRMSWEMQYYVFRIDENGLNTVPIGSPSNIISGGVGGGIIKCSPNGKKIAAFAGISGYPLALCDFDASNGQIHNEIALPVLQAIIGVEFSPNNRFLYVTYSDDIGNLYLAQLDISSGDSSQIMSSLKVLYLQSITTPNQPGRLQLAPNGKIYVTNRSSFGGGTTPSDILHVIHRPNLPAPDCQFQESGQRLTGTPGATFGLVNVAQNLFAQPDISFSKNAPNTICQLDSTYAFLVEKTGCYEYDSILWKLEGLSGSLTTDGVQAWVRFDAPGEGWLVVTAQSACGSVTDTLSLVVAEPFDKTLDLGPDQTVCDNGVFTFNAGSGFARYRWQDGTADSSLTTLLPGTYWVDVWDACGNLQSDTVTISIATATVLQLGDDLEGCSDLTLTFERPDFFTRWQWSPGAFLSCDTCASVTVAPAATTTWTIVAQTDDGCVSVDTLTIRVADTLFIQLDTIVCRGQQLDLFGVSLPADTVATFFFPATGPGCDTLLTVNVMGLVPPFTEIDTTICANETFLFNGTSLPADTTAIFVAPGMGGECDTVTVVQVSAYPPLSLTMPPDTTLRIGARLVLNVKASGTGTLNFAWSPTLGLDCGNCLSPEASPLSTTLYSLTVSDANGCEAQDSVLVTVDDVCVVVIPNAFTPNGDGVNDLFYPKTDPCVRLVRTWRVVSRWGDTVFESRNFMPNDLNYAWDGQRASGEPFPSDVLVWYVELEYYDGRVEVKKGDVVLLR